MSIPSVLCCYAELGWVEQNIISGIMANSNINDKITFFDLNDFNWQQTLYGILRYAKADSHIATQTKIFCSIRFSQKNMMP